MLRIMKFKIVVTPLLRSCDSFDNPERRHVFQCGDYQAHDNTRDNTLDNTRDNTRDPESEIPRDNTRDNKLDSTRVHKREISRNNTRDQTRDYCISGEFVCDGHMNCMVPGSEGVDEDEKYCRKSGTDRGIINYVTYCY